jgi:hypothetical protein
LKPSFKNLFDDYTWTARIFPAALALLPLAIFAFITSPKSFSASVITGNSFLVIVFAAFVYFLASIARSKGADLQEKLIRKWGGLPTTIILRHADNTIDVGTKARYHLRLSALPGAPALASEEEEQHSPALADQKYRSATTLLIEARRDDRLVKFENASYGFKRNLRGIRWIGVFISLVTALLCAGVWFERNRITLTSWSTVRDDLDSSWALPALFAGSLVWAVILIFQTSEESVWQAGVAYAKALLRTLDR